MASSRITKKVGVFGGTFDPIHNGHTAVARSVFEALDLDQVLFVVTSDQWLRENPPVAPASDRFNMVTRAVDNVLEFTASDVDIVRKGSTYTVDTLRDIREQFDDSTELYLIVGADSASSMNRWKSAEQIGDLAKIVAVGRPGQAFAIESLEDSHPANGAEYVEGPMIDVSATRVREYLSTGRNIEELVSESVVEYIEKQGLYR
jgi:nicotinate-nucleotide adenylyltransferase